MKHFWRWVYRVEDGILVTMLLAMILLAVAQIIMRDGFDGGLLWLDKLLRIMVLWIALWGAVVGSRHQRHVSIDLISRFLPALAKRAVHVLNALFVAGVCGLLARFAWAYVIQEKASPSPAFADVPTWVCESIMPVAFALMSTRYLFHAALMAIGREAPPSGGAV